MRSSMYNSPIRLRAARMASGVATCLTGISALPAMGRGTSFSSSLVGAGGYPTSDEEKEVLRRMAGKAEIPVRHVATPEAILAARKRIGELYMDDRIVDYIVDIVEATRNPTAAKLADLVPLIEYGASPRATLALAQGSRAIAFLCDRAYVTPDDVKAIAPDVLRHRVLITYEAEAEDVTSDNIISRILDAIPTP